MAAGDQLLILPSVASSAIDLPSQGRLLLLLLLLMSVIIVVTIVESWLTVGLA
jgi:hypothetical protein